LRELPAAPLPRLVGLPGEPSSAGDLVVIQANAHLPFAIRRVYFVHDIPDWAIRGGHAHKHCQELLVAATGAMTVTLEAQDGAMHHYRLGNPTVGLYIPPLYWRVVREYSPMSLCLVVASEDYDPAEYLRDHERFRRFDPASDADSLP
jgi:oxalate decarboxylase/phosphoglucose isomerase-like protein (cupin superfamily)